MPGDRQQTHQTVRRFKGETVFDWDNEPTSERPSEFTESTQYSGLWGPTTRPRNSTLEVPRPRPPKKRGGIGATWIAIIIAFAVTAGAVIGYMRYRESQPAPAPQAAAPQAATESAPAAPPAKGTAATPQRR